MELGMALVRAELRRRLGTYVAIALVVAVTGGVAMASLAGARRTSSAFERHLEASAASDLVINVATLADTTGATIDGLPGVERARSYAGLIGGAIDPDTFEPISAGFAEALVSLDGRFFDQDRPALTRGRLPDPERADEVIVNQAFAEATGLGAGDEMTFGYLSPETYEFAATTPVTITGVGINSDEVAIADIDDSQRIILTPAFLDEHPDAIADGEQSFTYYWTGLRLAPGTSVADTEAAWEEQTSSLLEGEATFRYRRAATLHAGVQRANRPQVVGLAAFGVLAALLAVGLTVQVTRRAGRTAAADTATLRALGASRLTASAGVVSLSVAAVVVGVVLAAIGAVVLSPLAPLGLVRDVEPDPGLAADALVLGLGGLLLIVVGVASTLLIAWRSANDQGRRGTEAGATTRLPLVTGFGVRRAVGRRSGAARSAVTGAVVATVAIVATLTFGADLRLLTTTPRLFGSDFDAALQMGAGYAQFDHAALDAFLEEGDDPDLEAWASVSYGTVPIEGMDVTALGVDTGRGSIGPSIAEGRPPAGPGEIVLGEDTLTAIGAAVGDEVEVPGGTATVVGTAVLPALGQSTGDHPGLGIGAWMSGDDLREAMAADAEASGASALVIRLRDGVDATEGAAALKRDLEADLLAWGLSEEDASESGSDLAQILAPARPAELVGTSGSLSAPALLSAILAAGALMALAFALGASVRLHRRELAVLKALGFERYQLVGTVAVQAGVTVGIGLLVGVPLGIALGGSLWRVFADQLGVLAETTVPVAAIAVTAVGALLLAVVLAVLPSRSAARTPAARILRAE